MIISFETHTHAQDKQKNIKNESTIDSEGKRERGRRRGLLCAVSLGVHESSSVNKWNLNKEDSWLHISRKLICCALVLIELGYVRRTS